MRLGATERSPENWNAALLDLQFLEAVDPADETGQQLLQERLQKFVREMRRTLRRLDPFPESAAEAAQAALDFIGHAGFASEPFPPIRGSPTSTVSGTASSLLLQECLQHADTWSDALDEFEGLGQIALMTIHKSKGLEFHTMIFYGLDNQTWWSLTPDRMEELNSFFVAFTRAKQRAFFTLCTERGQPVGWIESLLAPAGVRHINSAGLLAE